MDIIYEFIDICTEELQRQGLIKNANLFYMNGMFLTQMKELIKTEKLKLTN